MLEAGVWTLPGGVQLEVGRVSTAATVGRLLTNQWQAITFSDPFPATPVVLSQVQTNNDPHWVGTRQEAVMASGFQVATFALLSAGLEEEEANTAAHGPEVVGWLAIEPGQGSWNGHAYEAVQTGSVTHDWYAGSFALAQDRPSARATGRRRALWPGWRPTRGSTAPTCALRR